MRSLFYYLTSLLRKILPEKIQFELAAGMVRKYHFSYIVKDKLDILSQRAPEDNFAYIVKSGQSCDAVPLMDALTPAISGKSLCMDIGANIGITTVWMACNAGKVIAFEPEPANIARFNINIELNRKENIILEKYAVSDHKGEAVFHITDSYGHHSLGKVNTSKITGSLKVPLTTIDSYCAENAIDNIGFIKIDVEGFEEEVIKGGKSMLSSKKIDIIAFETSPSILKGLKKETTAVYDILNECGYVVCNLNRKPVTRKEIEGLNENADYIAFPEGADPFANNNNG